MNERMPTPGTRRVRWPVVGGLVVVNAVMIGTFGGAAAEMTRERNLIAPETAALCLEAAEVEVLGQSTWGKQTLTDLRYDEGVNVITGTVIAAHPGSGAREQNEPDLVGAEVSCLMSFDKRTKAEWVEVHR